MRRPDDCGGDVGRHLIPTNAADTRQRLDTTTDLLPGSGFSARLHCPSTDGSPFDDLWSDDQDARLDALFTG